MKAIVNATILCPNLGLIENGSIVFDGETIEISEDMTYGTPPAGSVEVLPPHSVFDTFYIEYAVNDPDWIDITSWDPADIDETFNIQPGEWVDGNIYEADKDIFYIPFLVDARLLDEEYQVHFDIYYLDDGELVFDPFSHDVQTIGGGVAEVPEPSSLLLFGIGMVGLAGVRRRMG